MNQLASWQKNNDDYIAASLQWLRLLLEGMAGKDDSSAVKPMPSGNNTASTPTSPPPPRATKSWMQRVMGQSPEEDVLETLVAAPKAPTPARSLMTDEEIDRAREAMISAEKADPPPAMVLLARQFGLSSFERDVLLLCAAMEMDTRIPALCSRAQYDLNRAYPTFALALRLFDEPSWDVLSPERPLRFWRLIEISMQRAQPLTTSPLVADERIVNYIKGLNYLDDRLSSFILPLVVPEDEYDLPETQQSAANTIVDHLQRIAGRQPLPVIQLLGSDSQSKQLVAWHASLALEMHVYRLPAELLPAPVDEMETLVRLWQRESILLPVVLYLDATQVERATSTENQIPVVDRFLARLNGLCFLDCREVWPGLNHSIQLEIQKPSSVEQKKAWEQSLGQDTGDSPALLAGQFNLNLSTIKQISRECLVGEPGAKGLFQSLWDSCLAKTRPQLDILAQRIDPKAGWDDIVIPEEERKLLREIAEQVRHRSMVYDEGGFRRKMNRGLGISALFAGESGTGKTMAAEVLANELMLNLYRIDLSGVVSKYIGETEKNLRRVFDAAEEGGAILLFDEADALFGKRSEVKDSHDRYANIEISYLLQRMETYGGLAILTTNIKSALDAAFLRRIRFIVQFRHPGPEERRTIWMKVFPPETRTEGLDYDRLARFNLSGGSIHNIALNAAFLAAGAKTPVTMPLVLRAARTEFRKLERPFNEAEFSWEHYGGGK